MGEIVNLRRARKARNRMAEETSAATNRAKHGTPRALREAAETEKRHNAHTLDAHRLAPDADPVKPD
ncbi:MAG TPA: DUF4169 family protein [Rhizomicrobium sp.]|jgi:hypothetical protein